MSYRYENLLSPLKVGGLVLRNRMLATAATPHFLQGKEPYFTEKWITHIANRAKNGAAAVCVNHMSCEDPDEKPSGPPPGAMNGVGKHAIDDTGSHFCTIDLYDKTAQNYVCQMVDAIHFYGAKANAYLPQFHMPDPPGVEDVAPPSPGGVSPEDPRKLVGPNGSYVDIITEEYMDQYIEKCCEMARQVKLLGFDMISVHCSYLGSIQAALLSPLTNHRTDQYGGSLENRARFILKMFSSMKKVVGEGFPLEAVISAVEPEGGVTLEDTIGFAKLAEGTIDILTLRSGLLDPQHPTGFTSTRECPTPFLHYAEAVKDSGARIIVSTSAGYQDLNQNEKIIAEGKADLISMARSWICDSDYGKKAREGRGEDVTPCIRCNKCHVPNDENKFRSFCSVNPLIGFEDKLNRMVDKPTESKKIAIVGGGPAGLQAAVTAAERGHCVTLYEKNRVLGGQLVHADHASFKWPLQDYKDFMIRQVYKKGVSVKLDTVATPDLLAANGFSDVIVAVGPVFTSLTLPGMEQLKTYKVMDVYGKAAELPRKMIVIGGSETGTETGMYLAENGIDVTVMTRQSKLAPGAAVAHYATMLAEAYKKLEHFHWITDVESYDSVNSNGLAYTANGESHFIEAQGIVFCTGVKADCDTVTSLYSPHYTVLLAGDCDIPGDLHRAISSGFSCASVL